MGIGHTIHQGRSAGANARVWAVVLYCLAWCSLPIAASAQAGEIAILQSSDLAAYRDAIAGFKSTVPSGTPYLEYDLQGDLELGKKLARKIRASDASLVVAVGLKAALAAKLEIIDIPIVYMMILDPAKHQLTGPNITGTTLEVPVERQLKVLRQFLPAARKLGTLYDPKKSGGKVKEATQQAAANQFDLQDFPVDSEKDVPQQLRALLSANDAMWLMPDSTVLTNESIRYIIEAALERHVPVIGFSPEFTKLGALLSISVNYTQVGRETGLLAKRILEGDRLPTARPVPIERLKITVNLKTAKFLGLSLPQEPNNLIDETY